MTRTHLLNANCRRVSIVMHQGAPMKCARAFLLSLLTVIQLVLPWLPVYCLYC